MNSPRSMPSLVIIDRHSNLTDEPSLLTEAHVRREDTHRSLFDVPDIESDDSLEAIGKKSNKYKKIMEQNRMRHTSIDKGFPLTQSTYTSTPSGGYTNRYSNSQGMDSNSGNHRFANATNPVQHRRNNSTGNVARLIEHFAPLRKFEDKKQNVPFSRHQHIHLQQNREKYYQSGAIHQRPLPFNSGNQMDLKQQINDKVNNKYSSRHDRHRMPEEIKITGLVGGGMRRSNKYAGSSSQHHRNLHYDEDDRERRSTSSHARLVSDSQDSLLAPSGGSTHYFSANSKSGRFSRTSGKSNGTGKHSKNSLGSLASSLDTGASPSEILAFGAVVDHLKNGGSIMNAKNVYRKEIQMLEKYGTEGSDPIEANLKHIEPHRGKIVPIFVKDEEIQCDDKSIEVSIDEITDDITLLEEISLHDRVYDSDELEFRDNEDDSVSTFKVDKYAMKKVEENDWCVEDRAGRTTAVAENQRKSKGHVDEESVGSATNFDETFFETSFDSESYNNSYYSDSDSDDSYTDDGENASYQSNSTIGSYELLTDTKNPRRAKKSKKKNFLRILKGKNRQKEENAYSSKLFQRLPDSFDDDNDENMNTGNHSKHKMQKRTELKQKKEYAKQPQNPITSKKAFYSEVNQSNAKSLNFGQQRKNMEMLGGSPIGARATMHGKTEGKPLKPNVTNHHPVEKQNDVPKAKENGKISADLVVPSNENTQEVISKALAETHNENSDPIQADESMALEITETSSYEFDDDEDTLCGGSVTMESLASIDETIENFVGGLENVAQFASEFATDSMRSARSLLFPENDDEKNAYSAGMTAADEFEAEVKAIEEPEESILHPKSLKTPIATPAETQKKVWVPEYADCDEGIEETGKNIVKQSTKPASSQKNAPIASVSVSKKSKSFRRKMSFMKSKKGGIQNKTYENDGVDDDNSYVVDIVVYNRNNDDHEKATENISAETFLEPKALMDTEEEDPDHNQRVPSEKPVATVNAPTSSDTLMADILSAGERFCGEVSINKKLIISCQLGFTNEKLKDKERTALSSKHLVKKCNKRCDSSPKSKSDSEGKIVLSFDNTVAALGSMQTEERDNSLRNPPPEENPIEWVLSSDRENNSRNKNNGSSRRMRSMFRKKNVTQGSF